MHQTLAAKLSGSYHTCLTDSLTHSKTLHRLFLVINFILISWQLTGHKNSVINGWA
jgi:hypothetical protein